MPADVSIFGKIPKHAVLTRLMEKKIYRAKTQQKKNTVRYPWTYKWK